MNNIEIRERAKSMAKEIQGIVDAYNRLDPAITFYPEITMVETTATTIPSSVKAFSVDVEVSYNTKNDNA